MDERGIRGWLIVVLCAYFISALSVIYLIYQRYKVIFDFNAPLGVRISVVLLILYGTFLLITILFIFMKRRAAVRTAVWTFVFGFIFLIWFYLLGALIFARARFTDLIMHSWIIILINLVVSVSLLVYMLRSERVKRTCWL